MMTRSTKQAVEASRLERVSDALTTNDAMITSDNMKAAIPDLDIVNISESAMMTAAAATRMS
jgi:hypothetical protein